MSGHHHIAALPADVLAVVADAAKRHVSGDTPKDDALMAYQSVIVDAVFLEAAAMAIDPDATEAIRGQVRPLITAVVRNFVAKNAPAADHRVTTAAERFGLIAAAGELAIRFGVLPWATGDVYKAAGSMFEAWLSSEAGIDRAQSARLHYRGSVGAVSS